MPKPNANDIINDEFTVEQLKEITGAERVRTLLDHDPENGKARYAEGYRVGANDTVNFTDHLGQTCIVPTSRLKRPEPAKPETEPKVDGKPAK